MHAGVLLQVTTQVRWQPQVQVWAHTVPRTLVLAMRLLPQAQGQAQCQEQQGTKCLALMMRSSRAHPWPLAMLRLLQVMRAHLCLCSLQHRHRAHTLAPCLHLNLGTQALKQVMLQHMHQAHWGRWCLHTRMLTHAAGAMSMMQAVGLQVHMVATQVPHRTVSA
jgi:hypothetical protein